MSIDHNLITPILSIDDPLLTCDIVGSGDRYAFRVNQDTLISANTKDYILAYRRKLFETRGLAVPADHDLSWRKDRAPLWTMDDLEDKATDLYLWVKFDELGLSDETSISTITDAGPQAHVLTAGNGITYNAGAINGLGVANMTADDDYFSIPDAASLDFGTGKIEMHCVFKTASDYETTWAGLMDLRYFADKKDTSGSYPRYSWKMQYRSSRGAITIKPTFTRMESSTTIDKQGNNTTLSNSTTYLSSVIQVDNTFDFYHNGSANGTPSGDNILDPDSDGILYIGNSDAKNSSIRGQLAEIVMIDHEFGSVAPQDAIREKIEGYLAHKWGLEGSLPSSHTYKTDPPRRDSVFA